MQPIEILYIISGIVALSACVPQLKQLVRTRETAELSLSTWAMWTATHTVTFWYVVSINNVLMAMICAAWVAFYATMTYLIIHYRHLSEFVYAEDMHDASRYIGR